MKYLYLIIKAFKYKKVLSFDEYRIQNAMYIQSNLQGYGMFKWSLEYIIAKMYYEYLSICGIDIHKFLDEINLFISDRYYSYDKEIEKNFVDIMNNILNTKYLNKKYPQLQEIIELIIIP